MKVFLIGYRSWAISAFKAVIKERKDLEFTILQNPEKLSKIENSVVLGAGWSWIIDQGLLDKNKIIALMHPSDLPNYAGGSPIQHQIIDGLTNSKATLFQVTKSLDGGPILYKTDLCLKGHMQNIFENLKNCTTELFLKFLNDYPNIPKTYQKPQKIYKRITPDDSRFLMNEISGMTTKELYNCIRSKEDPYPNMYIQDDIGKLYIRSADFVPHQ